MFMFSYKQKEFKITFSHPIVIKLFKCTRDVFTGEWRRGGSEGEMGGGRKEGETFLECSQIFLFNNTTPYRSKMEEKNDENCSDIDRFVVVVVATQLNHNRFHNFLLNRI